MTRTSIVAALRLLAERDPSGFAVRDAARSVTRSELLAEAERWAAVLAGRGVTADALVGIRLPNSVQNVAATVAVWMLGATPVPLSSRLALDEQRALVELGDLRVVVVEAEAADFPGRAVIATTLVLPTDRWNGPDLIAAHWKVVASGGSTGRPKLVVATADATVDPDRPVAPFVPQHAVQLIAAPLSHSAPFTYGFRGLMTGHSLVLLPHFEPREVLDAIASNRATWTMLVPTMMTRMLKLPEEVRAAADLTSLHSILHIGAPCAPEVKRGWIDWIGATRVVEVYAGSESAGLTMIRGDEWLEHPGSVGRGVSGSEFRVVDDVGTAIAPGETGLIQMRRGEQTYTYLGADARVDDGWHTLGDLGWIDDDGFLFVVDREDDLIVTGGEKVNPISVEQAAESLPGVRSAVAVGIRDDDLGQAVGLVLDTGDHEPPLQMDDGMVTSVVVTRAGAAARPRVIHTVNTPLRDDAGKVRRRAWREILERLRSLAE